MGQEFQKIVFPKEILQTQKIWAMGWGSGSPVKYLPSTHKAPGSILSGEVGERQRERERQKEEEDGGGRTGREKGRKE